MALTSTKHRVGPSDAGRSSAPTTPYIETLMRRLEVAGGAEAIRYQGATVTASGFAAMIYRYARALRGLGIGRGDLVAMFAPNRPEAMAVRYAANLLGAGATYLSAPASAQRRAEVVEQIAPTLLVAFPGTGHLQPIGLDCPIAIIGPGEADGRPHLDVLAAGMSGDPIASEARPDDLAVVISSGGTTGVPKGSWRNFTAYTAVVRAPDRSDRRQLVNGRLAYLSQVLVDMTLLGGGCVILRDCFDAGDTLAQIEAERVTDLFLVEPQLSELIDHPDVAQRDLSSLRALTHIGASAPPALRLRARACLGPVLAHTYGSSEMGLVSALPPADHQEPSAFASAGRILPGVEIRFRRNDGMIAAQGEAGEIEVRSPMMACGYWHRPAEEHKAFRDGWYRSGDLGFLDAEGRLRVLGRAANVVASNGQTIIPSVLEGDLCRLDDVNYAVVAPSPAHRDSWVVAIAPRRGMTIDPSRCRRAIAARYGDRIAASCRIVPVGRIPTTEQGKPDISVVQAL